MFAYAQLWQGVSGHGRPEVVQRQRERERERERSDWNINSESIGWSSMFLHTDSVAEWCRVWSKASAGHSVDERFASLLLKLNGVFAFRWGHFHWVGDMETASFSLAASFATPRCCMLVSTGFRFPLLRFLSHQVAHSCVADHACFRAGLSEDQDFSINRGRCSFQSASDSFFHMF